jgi:hypothetical protein
MAWGKLMPGEGRKEVGLFVELCRRRNCRNDGIKNSKEEVGIL